MSSTKRSVLDAVVQRCTGRSRKGRGPGRSPVDRLEVSRKVGGEECLEATNLCFLSDPHTSSERRRRRRGLSDRRRGSRMQAGVGFHVDAIPGDDGPVVELHVVAAELGNFADDDSLSRPSFIVHF